MKLVKTIIELEVYDKKYELRKPNFKESQMYREALLKLDESGDASIVMMDFLAMLGLPKEIFESLEFGHITEIMEAVTGSKKN
jgi:hypothetical protein